MILTVGYADLAPARLVDLATALDAWVVDVRAVPYGRIKRGFGRMATRGGKADPGWLPIDERQQRAFGGNTLLMCACECPGDCHRHHEIARPMLSLGIDALHICGDEVIAASELQRSIEDGDEYDCERLEDVIARVA